MPKGGQKMDEEKKADKKLAMYDAVAELLAEGRELSGIKVLDVTKKAGIGKGTAYEYFSSKEELLIKALFHFSKCTINRVLDQMEEQHTYREKVYFLFSQMEQKTKERDCTAKCVNLIFQSKKLKEIMMKYGSCSGEAEENPLRLIHYLMKEGKRQHFINETLPDSYLEIIFISKLISYLVYLEQKKKPEDCTCEEMKQLLYEGLLKEIKV